MKFIKAVWLTVVFGSVASHSENIDTTRQITGLKSEPSAYCIAVVGTFLPILAGTTLGWKGHEAIAGSLFALGAIAGPSLGEYYADSYWQGTLSIIGRGIGGALLVNSFAKSFGCAIGPSSEDIPQKNCSDGLFPVGLLLYTGTTVYSLIETHFTVKRINHGLSEKAGIKPVFQYDPKYSGYLVGALASLRF